MLKEITARRDRCDFEASYPAVFEITATEDRCQDSLTCPAIFQKLVCGRLVIIGKVGDFPELANRIGPDEIAIEIDAGIVERALAGRNMKDNGNV